MEGILLRIEELLTESAREPADEARVRGELDGLAALLESHFGYEERKLVAALNALPTPVSVPGGWLDHPQ